MTTFRRPSLLVVATALAGVASAQRAQFLPRPLAEQQYLTLGGALDVETGDLDGDGSAEIVVSETIFGAVTLLSNRLSQVGRFRYGFLSVVEGDMHDLELADLDGDSSPELLTMDEFNDGNQSCLWVFHNRGNGRFDGPVPHTVSVYDRGLRCADLDLDGDLDVAIVVLGRITVYDNLGDGTLASSVQHASGAGALRTSADLDLDGDVDLVTSGSFGLLVFPNPGDGSFSTFTSYSATGARVEHGDLDGDGDLDLATSAGNVLRNLGNGTFAATVDYDVGASASHDLTLADVDGDQRADLVVAVAGPDGIAILPNLGNGTFGAAHVRPLAFEPRRIASADFDRDGDIDLAPAEGGDILDGRLSVLLNRGNF